MNGAGRRTSLQERRSIDGVGGAAKMRATTDDNAPMAPPTVRGVPNSLSRL